MTVTALAEIVTVQVHAWSWVDYANGLRIQEYTDAADPDGWTVYLRVPTPDDPQQPFDIREERDFDDRNAALAYAAELSAANGDAMVDFY